MMHKRPVFSPDTGRRRMTAMTSQELGITSPAERAAAAQRRDATKSVRWARDKLLSYQLAESLGLGYPRTWTAATAAEAAELDVPFPVIIKPSVKTGLNALTAAKAWRVDDRDQLARRFGEAAALVDPSHLMVQELIPGRGADQLSYAALCEHGRPLAGLTARRSRQYPADFGRASTFVETVVAADVEEAARAFLAEARFDGLVEVEFMRDPRDGVLRRML